MTIRCNNCGRFIGSKEIEGGLIKYHFVPDTFLTEEEAWYEHIKC